MSPLVGAALVWLAGKITFRIWDRIELRQLEGKVRLDAERARLLTLMSQRRANDRSYR